MKIYVVNGPNINMLGIREPNIYGKETYEDLLSLIDIKAKQLNVEANYFQSNVEGELVNIIQRAYYDKADGVIINPAAYTHTSIAILDAIKAIGLPVIEVHISNINEREEFRKESMTSKACIKTIVGHGLNGYVEALEELVNYIKEKSNE